MIVTLTLLVSDHSIDANERSPLAPPVTAPSRRILDASDAFRQAVDKDDLWKCLHRHLAEFGISGVLYGTDAMAQSISDRTILLDSLRPGYLETKQREGALESDEFIRTGLIQDDPILWDPSSVVAARFADFSPEARLSLDIDWSYGITTGVTLPMRFADGLGVSGMGCHAERMSWGEFDRMWRESGEAVITIACAFDTTLRRNHIHQLFPLNAEERECLLWLAAGLQQKQIADRLRLTDKQVGKRFETARAKLRAVTTAQAMATALIFGLIDP